MSHAVMAYFFSDRGLIMLMYFRDLTHTARKYLLTFLKWLLIASVLGAACGLIGAAFRTAIDAVTLFRGGHGWVIWLLPLGGIAIVLLYSVTRQEGIGTPTVIDAVLHKGRIPPMMAPVIFAATTLTHFLGGSSGREGAALQIGGSLGSFCAVTLRLKPSDRRITILCGMAAVFTALFGTPVGAALFVLEVSDVGAICYSALVPCVIASGTAYAVTGALNIQPTRFTVPMPELSLGLMGKVLVLAMLCALLSVVICTSLRFSEQHMSRWIKNPMLRAAAGGAAILALTYALGTTDYNGAGEPIFRQALEQGSCAPEAFALKLLFTVITLSCGFKGGEVVPTFFMGATFGCILGPVLGLPAGFAAAIGLSATFCGATNCPLATLLLSAELFGGGRLETFAAACAISYLFSGYCSLYPNQMFLYSKVDAELLGEEKEEASER